MILNGEKYREKMNQDERREMNRVYQKRHRDKKKREWPKSTPLRGESLNEKSVENGTGEVHLHDLTENRVDGE